MRMEEVGGGVKRSVSNFSKEATSKGRSELLCFRRAG